MAIQPNKKGDNDYFLTYLADDCLEKILKKEIFYFDNFLDPFMDNTKPLIRMDDSQRDSIVKSIRNHCYNNQDKNRGYYYYKFIIAFILKFILIITQCVLSLYYLYPKYYCVNEEVSEEDNIFWLFDKKKYKVKKVQRSGDKTFYLRLIYFILYDFIFFFLEVYIIANMQRIKSNKYLILIFQLFKFILCGIIIFFDITENTCENSFNDTNIFYIKNNILEKFQMIFDIIKIIIN